MTLRFAVFHNVGRRGGRIFEKDVNREGWD